MVTQLPSTGAPGCDTSDMVMIHGLFRSVYAEAPALVAGVAPGDTARAEIVGDHVAGLADSLHTHHHSEDLLLWDQLEARNPACAKHVGQMRTQHAAMGAELDKLTAAITTWKADPSRKNRDAVSTSLAAINKLLTEHLGAEEKQILPVASAAFTQPEWDQLGEHSRASVPKEMQFIQLGFILDSMAEADRAVWFKKNLPAPIRLLYNLVGKKQYEKYRSTVYG
jgi:hemerythrin-like domain-containing protein